MGWKNYLPRCYQEIREDARGAAWYVRGFSVFNVPFESRWELDKRSGKSLRLQAREIECVYRSLG